MHLSTQINDVNYITFWKILQIRRHVSAFLHQALVLPHLAKRAAQKKKQLIVFVLIVI